MAIFNSYVKLPEGRGSNPHDLDWTQFSEIEAMMVPDYAMIGAGLCEMDGPFFQQG